MRLSCCVMCLWSISAATRQGASVVLPGVTGIRGCGKPTERAELSRVVMDASEATLLLGDAHTLKELAPAVMRVIVSCLDGTAGVGEIT